MPPDTAPSVPRVASRSPGLELLQKPDRSSATKPGHSICYGHYSLDGACTNNAESFFSRMRRAEIGHHYHLAGPYLLRFAQESGWREDHRRDPNGFQVDRVIALAMRN